MRIHKDVKYSIILPSRYRKAMLIQCIESFYRKAVNKKAIEFIVIVDVDDIGYSSEVSQYLHGSDANFTILTVRRGRDHMTKNYYNYGTQCSNGDFVWAMNDDVEMTTEGWDEVLDGELSKNTSEYKYVIVDDASGSKTAHANGCAFPIVSREVAEKMNGLFPEEINMWGADMALWSIIKESPECVVDLFDKIKLLHHSVHNGTRDRDEATSTGQNHSHNKGLTDGELRGYRNRLKLGNSTAKQNVSLKGVVVPPINNTAHKVKSPLMIGIPLNS